MRVTASVRKLLPVLPIGLGICALVYFIATYKSYSARSTVQTNIIDRTVQINQANHLLLNYAIGQQNRVLLHLIGQPATQIPSFDKVEVAKLVNPSQEKTEHFTQFEALLVQLEQIEAGINKALADSTFSPEVRKANVHNAVTYKLLPTSKEISQLLAKIETDFRQQTLSVEQSASIWSTIQHIAMLLMIVLAIVFVILIANVLNSTIDEPLDIIASQLVAGQPLPASDSEVLNTISNGYNQAIKHLNDYSDLALMVSHFKPITPSHYTLTDSQITPFVTVIEKAKNKDTQLLEANQRIEWLNKKVSDLDTYVVKQENFYQSKIERLLDAYFVCELDLAGTIKHANEQFLTLTGHEDLLGKSFQSLFAENGKSNFAQQLWRSASNGHIWQGTVCINGRATNNHWMSIVSIPVLDNNSAIESVYLLGTDVSPLIAEKLSIERSNQELQQHLNQHQQQVTDLRTNITKLKHEKDIMKLKLEEQKQLEYRLIQQQTALQLLTRNDSIKNGDVKQSLNLITETTSFALDEERTSIWLFTKEGKEMHSVDVYDKSTMVHHNFDFVLLQDQIPFLFKAIQNEEIISVEDIELNEHFTAFPLRNGVSKLSSTRSLMISPLHLGTKVIGMIMLERMGTAKHWSLDEQNFLMAVADLVSLSLEHGNRLAMEEELRITLEETQALDEELRQNAEEIEATNEEMRRTQIELRGQINAMNNSAIVSETNLMGLITYANKEFLSVYKFSKQEVIGKSHQIVRSNEHAPEFWTTFWETIKAGKVWKGDICNQSKDGKNVWISVSITPVLGIDNQPYKYIAVAFDITRQKLQSTRIKEALQTALEQEEQLRKNTDELIKTNSEMLKTQVELSGQLNALNNSSMVFEMDVSGKFISVNPAFLERSLYQLEELVGQDMALVKSGRQSELIFQDLWKAVGKGQSWRGELELANKEGSYFWVVATLNPVLDVHGDLLKVITVMFDISEQKKQEFRLIKQQSTLLEINSNAAVKEGNVKKAFQIIANLAMDTLQVRRASIWQFIENGRKVRCTTVTNKDSHEHNEGTILDIEMYPMYFRTLDRDRIIAADDAVNDPRTKELAFTLLKPLGIAAVMDVTIRQANKTVGILSFEHADSKRNWTLDEQSFATSVADTISLVLEQKERQLNAKLKKAYAQLEEANKEVMRQKLELEETTKGLAESIKYAKRIQTNILPSKEYLDKFLGKDNYFVVHRQRDTVGGDFYWFEHIDDKHIMVVADGTGHGVPGAFLTLIGYLLLNQIVIEKRIVTPGDILYELHIGVRIALKQEDPETRHASRDGMDVAVMMVDTRTNRCEYAGANLPFYYYQDWEIHEVKPTKKSIGGEQLEEERVFENHVIQLKSGDAVYLYTDGFVDQFGGPEEKRFSTKRFRDLILRTQHESMSTQRAMLNMEWKDWKEDREQLDDVTVFGLKVP